MRKFHLSLLLFVLGIVGCTTAVASEPTPSIELLPQSEPLLSVAATPAIATSQSLPTVVTSVSLATPDGVETAVATQTATATPPPTRTPTPTPTPGSCQARIPDDTLLTIVTQTYGLSADYEPTDLLNLNDYFGVGVTLGLPSELRHEAVEPLIKMVSAMHDAGLTPYVVSGYRSHYAQSVAYAKWAQQFPDRVDAISARPGHSEHQLGTTVDFSSPELPALTGDPNLQFHTYFDRTSEGAWLRENAHLYGYTLSYPPGAYEVTGFHYEPWHYRYIGVELATHLKQLGISFTEFQLLNEPPPCIPN